MSKSSLCKSPGGRLRALRPLLDEADHQLVLCTGRMKLDQYSLEASVSVCPSLCGGEGKERREHDVTEDIRYLQFCILGWPQRSFR